MTTPKGCRYDEMEGVRTDSLFGLFNNWHRAEVVETNDPLNMGRVRFKCPEMHDEDLNKDDYPWALPAPSLGGAKSGEWRSPTISDIVFIAFEEGHPYSPIWTSAADPTRREQYTLPSIHIPTPLPVDAKGEPADHPDDYDDVYLPKDGRPMSQGLMDRYGNVDMLGAVGFFPVEHNEVPPEPDYDAVQKSRFQQSQKSPVVNNPDSKFMLRMSKYGHMMINADQGYWWQRKDPPQLTKAEYNELTEEELEARDIQEELGEFYGDSEKDRSWEVSRWRYMRDLLHEGDPEGKDQRRLQLLTRYGSKLEMRDVGWAQLGPVKSATRLDEFGEPRLISKEEVNDFRWIKMRTKAGMLFQMYDKGSHPNDDNFVKRLLKDETGPQTEREDEYWGHKDARFIRLISRYGYKIVIDDRGSDARSADEKESPRGNGVLIKGRRSAGTGGVEMSPSDGARQCGFYWEFNENDSTNMTTWGTPAGVTVQMSDKLQYFMAVAARREYSTPWQKHRENEFLLEPLVSQDTELKTHHLKLDHDNEYIRLKTRSGKGAGPMSGYAGGGSINEVEGGEQQGLECRDGVNDDGPWAELVDIDRRGAWFSHKFKLSVFRASTTASGHCDMLMWYNETTAEYVLRNNLSSSKLQIYCLGDVEIISQTGTLNIKAQGDISVKSDTKISMQGGNAKFELSGRNPKLSGPIITPDVIKKRPNIRLLPPPIPVPPPKIQPEDRGKRYNSALEAAANRDEIEHPI